MHKQVPITAFWVYDSITARPPASSMETKHKSGQPG